MTNPSREAFKEWWLVNEFDVVSEPHEMLSAKKVWQAALSEGRRQEREEIALDSLETKYSYAEILQMAAEAIKRIAEQGSIGMGPRSAEKAGDAL